MGSFLLTLGIFIKSTGKTPPVILLLGTMLWKSRLWAALHKISATASQTWSWWDGAPSRLLGHYQAQLFEDFSYLVSLDYSLVISLEALSSNFLPISSSSCALQRLLIGCFVCFTGKGHIWQCSEVDSWLCKDHCWWTHEGRVGAMPCGMLGIKPVSTACKASTLPTALILWL